MGNIKTLKVAYVSKKRYFNRETLQPISLLDKEKRLIQHIKTINFLF